MKLRLALCVSGTVAIRWTRIQVLAALILSPTAGLRKFAELRDEGILTNAEFEIERLAFSGLDCMGWTPNCYSAFVPCPLLVCQEVRLNCKSVTRFHVANICRHSSPIRSARDQFSGDEIRHTTFRNDAVRPDSAWAGKLGGGPRTGSTLESDIGASTSFRTERREDPFIHAWAFAETLGLVATNHETILSESFQGFANGLTSKPVTVVTTMARVVLESLAVQAWLIDPSVATEERFARWIALEYQSQRESWRTAHPRSPHLRNPAASELLVDARTLTSRWTKVPHRRGLAQESRRQLNSLAASHNGMPTTPEEKPLVSTLWVRRSTVYFPVRFTAALAASLPYSCQRYGHSSGNPMHTYDLSHDALWNAMSLILISTFAAHAPTPNG